MAWPPSSCCSTPKRSGKESVGFDAARGEYVDRFEAGIIDAVKVARRARENAVWVARTSLLTEATLAEVRPPGVRRRPPRRDADGGGAGRRRVAAMAQGSAFQLGRVGGIAIRLDVTFLLALPLIAWLFARSFPEAARAAGAPAGALPGSAWAWGVGLTAGLFVSVLLHELAHCWVLLRRGGRARSITLLMIGGVTEVAEPPRDPRAEPAIALAGPGASLVLGVVLAAASSLALRLGAPTLGFALLHLGRLNVVLGLFNLLPAFPMDGGRIVRGLLLRRRSAVDATRIAANLGKAFAAMFAAYGFASSNLLLILVAFVVFVGATAEQQGVLARTLLGDLRVREIMTAAPSTVGPDDSVFEVAARMIRDRRVALPVCEGGTVLGFVRLRRVERMALEERRGATARAVMDPPVQVGAADRVLDAMRALGPGAADHLAVVEDGRLVGVVSAFDVERALRLRGLAVSQQT